MRRTVLNNLHGIPTDTPTYEKNGWTGDVQVGAPSMLAEFGMAKFFTKWLGDVADSQDAAGHLPVIVPSGGWGYRELAPAPEWTTVYPFLLREMYRIYGDDRLPVQHWPVLTRYLDSEIGRLRDGLSVTALGDWLPPGSEGVPPEDTRLTATAYLYRALLHTAEGVVGAARVHQCARTHLRGVDEGRRRAAADRRGAGRLDGGGARTDPERLLCRVRSARELEFHRGSSAETAVTAVPAS